MSKPKNILGKFDTYAYHHILVVCNSTTAAESLAKKRDITQYQHPRNPTQRYKARDIGHTGEKYVTLIDGMTDARFFITDVKWTNYIAADPEIGKGNIPQSTTMSVDGEIEIIEAMGATFLNRLTDIADELDSDPVGLVFLLKTIFVGRNADGLTEMISTVRPMMFVPIDITAVFQSSGASYKMEFVGLTNGAGRLPQPQKIFEGMSLTLDTTSLKKTMDLLEINVNDKYAAFKEKAKNDFAATFTELGVIIGDIAANEFLEENYRDVKYRIILDKVYEDDTRYKAGDIMHIRAMNSVEVPHVNFGPDISIEDMLSQIMSACSGVLDDSNGKGTTVNESDNKPAKYLFKVISVIKSTPAEYVVEYHIKRFLHAENAYTQQAKNGVIVPLPGQSIEFDYIFTGKNVDIKDFDIKMEMGMAFFQMAATTNNIPDQKTAINGNKSKTVNVGGSNPIGSTGKHVRKSTPLFLGTTINKPAMRNTTRPIDTAGFQALLDRHASLENISASMVIYGNPQLLDEMQILPSEITPPVTQVGTTQPVAQTEDPVKDKTINPQWMNTPTLVKINIKMPVDTNDVNTEYEAFWYTGWYNLQVVENIFSDGVFTQELGMYSIPVSDQTQEITDVEEDLTATTALGSLPTVDGDLGDVGKTIMRRETWTQRQLNHFRQEQSIQGENQFKPDRHK